MGIAVVIVVDQWRVERWGGGGGAGERFWSVKVLDIVLCGRLTTFQSFRLFPCIIFLDSHL